MVFTLWCYQSVLSDVPSPSRLDLQPLEHDRHKLIDGERLVVETVPGVRPVGLCRLVAALGDMAIQVRTDRPGKGVTRTLKWKEITKLFRVAAVFVPVPEPALPDGLGEAISSADDIEPGRELGNAAGGLPDGAALLRKSAGPSRRGGRRMRGE